MLHACTHTHHHVIPLFLHHRYAIYVGEKDYSGEVLQKEQIAARTDMEQRHMFAGSVTELQSFPELLLIVIRNQESCMGIYAKCIVGT